jgi:hypothetical protein
VYPHKPSGTRAAAVHRNDGSLPASNDLVHELIYNVEGYGQAHNGDLLDKHHSSIACVLELHICSCSDILVHFHLAHRLVTFKMDSIPGKDLEQNGLTRMKTTESYTFQGQKGWRRWRILRPGRGMYHDVKRRAPYYWSDITDAFTYRTFASTVRMYFVK